MQYNGKKVIKHRSARFIPSDSKYEDCICDLILTYNILYVLEDEYDGKYTTHFTIPVKNITCIEKYVEEDSCGKSSGKGASSMQYLISGTVMALGGLILLPGRAANKKEIEYLRIVYYDELGKDCYLYFNGYNKNINGFIKAVQKLSFGAKCCESRSDTRSES